MPGGTHARIANALDTDAQVLAAIQAKLDDPNNAVKRTAVIEVITRSTANCIGQAVARKPFTPGDSTLSVFKALKGGTDAEIVLEIGGSADTHAALATADVPTIVRKISRMTGNCIGQAAVAQGIGLLGLIKL